MIYDTYNIQLLVKVINKILFESSSSIVYRAHLSEISKTKQTKRLSTISHNPVPKNNLKMCQTQNMKRMKYTYSH